ncbi:30S ribosomal protein S18 [Microgenomates group bacterium]|nr:30S ribosomal protein S18 [Microgenomates group bacterium]
MKQKRKPKKEKIIKLNIDKRIVFSYKEPEVLRTCINEQGMLAGRIQTGLSRKAQKKLAVEVKRARHLALLPFVQTV